MNVASLELCKELYELSGWKVEDNYWVSVRNHHALHFINYYHEAALHRQKGDENDITTPAYDLGYLLRKIPGYMKLDREYPAWRAYHSEKNEYLADTPEDAVCLMAIELFKQGILTKEIQSS